MVPEQESFKPEENQQLEVIQIHSILVAIRDYERERNKNLQTKYFSSTHPDVFKIKEFYNLITSKDKDPARYLNLFECEKLFRILLSANFIKDQHAAQVFNKIIKALGGDEIFETLRVFQVKSLFTSKYIYELFKRDEVKDIARAVSMYTHLGVELSERNLLQLLRHPEPQSITSGLAAFFKDKYLTNIYGTSLIDVTHCWPRARCLYSVYKRNLLTDDICQRILTHPDPWALDSAITTLQATTKTLIIDLTTKEFILAVLNHPKPYDLAKGFVKLAKNFLLETYKEEILKSEFPYHIANILSMLSKSNIIEEIAIHALNHASPDMLEKSLKVLKANGFLNRANFENIINLCQGSDAESNLKIFIINSLPEAPKMFMNGTANRELSVEPSEGGYPKPPEIRGL